MSWLKYLHTEYLSHEQYVDLATFDINDPADQEALIKRFIFPDFGDCNAVSHQSMMQTLIELPNFPESKVREMLWSAGPLTEKLHDYRAFFDEVRAKCEALQAKAPTREHRHAGPSSSTRVDSHSLPTVP